MRKITLIIIVCWLPFNSASAKIWDDIPLVGDAMDGIGDVLEDGRDKVRAEARRTIQHAEELARKARAESKRLEARVRKLRDEVKGELEKIPVLGKAINEVIDATEIIIESSGDVIKQNANLIGVIETVIVDQKLDPYEIIIESTSNVLGKKISAAITGGKINNFLDSKILGDIKIIDILMPIQSGLERIDPTGMQSCIRNGVVSKTTNTGLVYLSGAPENFLKSLADVSGLEVAAAGVVVGCLNKHVSRRPKEGNEAVDQSEITDATAERDAAIQEVKMDEELERETQIYYDEVHSNYEKYRKILDDTKELAEEAKEAQEANEAVARKLAEKMKEAGINPETFADLTK